MAEKKTGKTVEISEEKLEALMADVALMKEKLADEERRRGIADKKLMEEEEERQRVLEANRKAMEKVPYHAELGAMRSNKNLEVSVNGKQYVIPRGQTVMIPRCVAEVLNNSKNQLDLAYGLQEKRAAEFAREELEMARTG